MHYQTVCRIFVLGNCLCIRVCAYARNRVNILVSLYAHARIVIREERGVERRKGGLQLALTHLLQKFISTNMSDLSSWHLHSLYQTAAAPGIYAKHGNMTPVMIDTWYKTWRAHMQITSIYSKITNCSYKTAYACTRATRRLRARTQPGAFFVKKKHKTTNRSQRTPKGLRALCMTI